MKKILLALMVFAAVASANVVLGANLGYGNIKAEATLAGDSATADSKYTSFEVKAGYQWEQVRALGFIGSDRYKDDMLIQGEGNAKYIGVEVDTYLTYKKI